MADEDESEPKDEPLAEYISRLERFSGTERLRVPRQFIDKHGNILLPPEAIYLVDEEGAPHASADTAGFVKATTYGIGAGGVRSSMGTFTKNATGTTGAVTFTAGADDIIYFMYGFLLTGAVHAGVASPLTVGLGRSTGSTNIMQRFLYDATADINETFQVLGLGEVSGITKTTAAYTPLQVMIPSTAHFTEDGPGVAGALPRFIVEWRTMANAEDFFYDFYFFSVNNTAVVSSPIAGAIA